MYSIRKEFSFSAAHQLIGLPFEHPCSRMHGHNYKVSVHIESPKLNAVGFVIDYRELDTVKVYIDGELDHQNLNEVLDFNPTAENLAAHFYRVIIDGDVGRILEETHDSILDFQIFIGVSETDKTWAYYSEDDVAPAS